MTFENSQEATRAAISGHFDYTINIADLQDEAKSALEAFNLYASEDAQITDTNVTVIAGPVAITMTLLLDTGATDRIEVTVTRMRDSEALHPDAETAILAEIVSLLAERHGGDTVEWTEAGVVIPKERFVTAFTPMRRRGGSARIAPRRICRTDTIGTPIVCRAKAPTPVLAEETCDAFRDIFTHDDAKPDNGSNGVQSVSAWAATASVGVMNPLIGVPLAAYNLTCGADVRVSTHAFALTAILSGFVGSSFTYLPF